MNESLKTGIYIGVGIAIGGAAIAILAAAIGKLV